MPLQTFSTSHRLRTTLAATAALALAASGLVATSATAAPVGDCAAGFTASTQAEWIDAVAGANGCATAAVTITLTDDLTLTAVAGSYYGPADLTLDGGGHTVTLDGANRFLYVAGISPQRDVAIHDLSLAETGSAAVDSYLFLTLVDDVTIQNVALTGQGNFGIFVDQPDALEMSGISITDTVTTTSALDVNGAGSISLGDSTVTGAMASSTGVVNLVGNSITVTDSTFDGNSSGNSAGALYLEGAALSIAGSHFLNNSSASVGGAVAAYGTTLSITSSASRESHFEGNTSGNSGGAVYAQNTTVTVEDASFLGNEATSQQGGAISAGMTTVVDSTFRENTSSGTGGAIYSNGLDISGSTFDSNTSDSGSGGAVYGWTATIADSTFRGNTARSVGGAVAAGAATIDGSTFVGNANAPTGSVGGALYVSQSSAVRDSTFVDNSSPSSGGAIYSDAHLALEHTTFSGNAATNASHIYASSFGAVNTYASVFADGLGGSGCLLFGTVTSRGYNFDDTGTCTDGHEGTGDIGAGGADPMVGSLADNDGPTHTMLPAADSPLIDAIPTLTCAGAITADANLEYDQRGVQRHQGEGCDIGAVEVIPDLTFTIDADSGPIEVTVTNALSYDCVTWVSATGYSPTPPADVSFPHGIFGYCFTLPDDGWGIDITLDLPTPVNQLWKVTDTTWDGIADAVIDGTTVTYSIADGGALDQDGTVDGEILDPVAPGIDASFTG